MKTYSDKLRERGMHMLTTDSLKANHSKSTFQLVDNRPESEEQKVLHEIASSNPQTHKKEKNTAILSNVATIQPVFVQSPNGSIDWVENEVFNTWDEFGWLSYMDTQGRTIWYYDVAAYQQHYAPPPQVAGMGMHGGHNMAAAAASQSYMSEGAMGQGAMALPTAPQLQMPPQLPTTTQINDNIGELQLGNGYKTWATSNFPGFNIEFLVSFRNIQLKAHIKWKHRDSKTEAPYAMSLKSISDQTLENPTERYHPNVWNALLPHGRSLIPSPTGSKYKSIYLGRLSALKIDLDKINLEQAGNAGIEFDTRQYENYGELQNIEKGLQDLAKDIKLNLPDCYEEAKKIMNEFNQKDMAAHNQHRGGDSPQGGMLSPVYQQRFKEHIGEALDKFKPLLAVTK